MPTNSSVTSSLIRGPAQVQWQGCTFWSPGDISVSIVAETDELDESSLGEIDQTHDQIHAEIRLVPAGIITPAILTALFPYWGSGWLPGASLRGVTDSPLVIAGRDGTQYTFSAVAITQQPSLQLGLFESGQTLFGPMTFVAFRQGSAPWSASGSLWSSASLTYPGDTQFQTTDHISSPAQALFASSLDESITSFSSQTGFKIESRLITVPLFSDGSGLMDLTYGAIQNACSCIPAVPGSVASEPSPSVFARLFNFQGTGAIRGGSRTLASGTLSVAANGLYVTMRSVAIRRQDFLFGQKLRQGELVFSQTANSSAPATASAPQSLVHIGTHS